MSSSQIFKEKIQLWPGRHCWCPSSWNCSGIWLQSGGMKLASSTALSSPIRWCHQHSSSQLGQILNHGHRCAVVELKCRSYKVLHPLGNYKVSVYYYFFKFISTYLLYGSPNRLFVIGTATIWSIKKLWPRTVEMWCTPGQCFRTFFIPYLY